MICLATGELSGGGWGGGNYNFNLPSKNDRGDSTLKFLALANPIPERILEYLPLILAGVAALILLVLFWIYVASVFRFILFESVLYDRCEIRKGWRRWQEQGNSFFLWQIGFGLLALAVMVVLIGGPVLLAWLGGVFREPGRHVVLLVLGGLLLLFLFVAIAILGAIVAVFTKDFVVPVMALENVGVLEGWRRVLPMLGAEKGPYAIYILMKMVLAVGAALVTSIASFIVLLILLVPMGIGGVAAVLLGKAAGLTWNLVTISAAVLAGLVALGLILFVLGMLSSPAMVFFQSYTLHFFGSRYPTLGTQLYPGSPGPPATGTGSPAAAPLPTS